MTSFFNATDITKNVMSSALCLTGIAARHTPYRAQKTINEYVLHLVFQDLIDDGDLNCLLNKTIQINITDIEYCITLTLVDNQLRMVHVASAANAIIRGNLTSFIQLATRNQDPDTLFFQRKLSIEGDTELGLTIKNIMDGIDFDNLPVWIRSAILGVKKIERAIFQK